MIYYDNCILFNDFPTSNFNFDQNMDLHHNALQKANKNSKLKKIKLQLKIDLFYHFNT